jgi:hypothetical protein
MFVPINTSPRISTSPKISVPMRLGAWFSFSCTPSGAAAVVVVVVAMRILPKTKVSPRPNWGEALFQQNDREIEAAVIRP